MSMKTQEIEEALAQLREVRGAVLERQRFRGFSGLARMGSGVLALAVAALMSVRFYPANTRAHLLGWGMVFIGASLLNGGALLYWFLNDPRVKQNIFRLKPILCSVPPLFVGAVLTAALVLGGQHRYLFGVWMSMFGLTNLASRHVLPPWMALVGVFYVLCGAGWLLAPNVSFLDPWPMGVVFFIGELASGLILQFDARRYLSFLRFQEVIGEKGAR